MTVYENRRFEDLYLELETLEDIELYGCTFVNCTFMDMTVYNCKISECTFIRCNIVSPKCRFTTIRLASLEDSTVRNVDWSGFSGSGFINEPLYRISRCLLQYNRFGSMQLRKFRFSSNELKDCIFSDCNLTDSIFKDSDLTNTEYVRCDLTRADFRDSFGYRINVNSNNVKGAKFSAPEALRLLDCFGIMVE